MMNRRDFLKTTALVATGAALPGRALGARPVHAGESAAAAVSAGNAKPGMRYRPMGGTGAMVSALGFGMMRPPMLPDRSVDEEEFRRMVRHAIDNGVNYIDTSYIYSGGKSEEITGRILAGGYREKVHLATKLPWWEFPDGADFDRLLDRQLENLQTDVIDFYLAHSVTRKGWDGPIREFKLIEKVEKAKERGKIRHMGFSFHDTLPLFKEVMAYTPNWEFCQLRFNYLDKEYEAGISGVSHAFDKGMGVIAMEPLSAGFLANLPSGVDAILARSEPKRGQVEWAFDYLWNMPEISMVLSGMSAMRHVVDNLEYASRSSVGMLGPRERAIVAEVKRHLADEYGAISCVGCMNCQPCPEKVGIAFIFSIWNQYQVGGDLDSFRRRHNNITDRFGFGVSGAACTECGKCIPKCPYGIDVIKNIKTIRKIAEA
jgi:predicted aldo/keto reductase-like oxidoreductase